MNAGLATSLNLSPWVAWVACVPPEHGERGVVHVELADLGEGPLGLVKDDSAVQGVLQLELTTSRSAAEFSLTMVTLATCIGAWASATSSASSFPGWWANVAQRRRGRA